MSAIPLEDEREPREVWEWALGILVVVVSAFWVAYRLHVVELHWNGPIPHVGSLVFRNTTTNGGDMGAHVYWPWFLEHNWFLKGRLAGWSPSWYSGFPIGQYYFPFPAVLTSIFDLLLPYNVAFKLVTVIGPISMPVGAYLLADQLEFPWPAAPLSSVSALYYQFELRRFNGENTWTIYGGNLASGLAGEFSFTLSLSLSLFFLAAFVFTLRTGKRAWVPALLFALCVTSHVVVAMAASFLAVLVYLHYRPLRTWRIAIPVGVVGAFLTMVWTVPLLMTEPYTSSMRYEKVTKYSEWLFGPGEHFSIFGLVPLPKPLWLWGLILAAVLGGGFWLRRCTLIIVIWATAFGLAFVVWPRDVAVWNTRFIPFYFLALAFLAALGATELLRFAAYLWRGVADWNVEGSRLDRIREWRAHQPAEFVVELPADTDVELVEAVPSYLDREIGRERRRRRRLTMSVPIAVGLLLTTATAMYQADENGRAVVSYWAFWNYSGYEAKQAWPEYSNIMSQMGTLGKSRGCGRAMWEPSSGTIDGENDPINLYGTSLALELLPYFTNDCIGSMEGLYFESSATKDAHFLTLSNIAQHPSNPVRGLDYGSTTRFAEGVEQARMLGVRYLMFFASESQTLARQATNLLDPVLTIDKDVDGKPPKSWQVYEIKGWGLVEGLKVEPVVVEAADGTDATCWPNRGDVALDAHPTKLNGWECVTAPQWMDPEALGQPLAEDGPAQWRRITVRPKELQRAVTGSGASAKTVLQPTGTSVLAPVLSVPRRTIDPPTVSDVRETVDSLRFHVDEIGKPVVVRSSYFPNWEVSGAKGPYRLAPNLMVVIPTRNDVALTYGLTGPDWIGRFATLLGIIGLVLLAWKFRSLPAHWTADHEPPGRRDPDGLDDPLDDDPSWVPDLVEAGILDRPAEGAVEPTGPPETPPHSDPGPSALD